MKIDWNKKEDKEIFWHSASHLMTQAVLRVFKGQNIGLGVGTATDDGFYQDYDIKELKFEDLEKIEKEMKKIVEEKLEITQREIPKKDALKFYKNDPYKTELANVIEGDKVSMFKQGEFDNLCKGPHVQNTSFIKAFKLTKIAGAYWRGNEKNKMLTRVYGIAFPEQKMLDEWLKARELAEQRSHLKIGKEQELFLISDLVGSGLVLWTPKGHIIREQLINFLRREQIKRGYKLVTTPHIGKIDLYKKSGHLQTYKESMYSPIKVDEEEYILKPMNCPHHIMIYAEKRRSYRELPLRLAEFGTVYRYEKSGELFGLVRVRGFTQDDSHIFCTHEQLKTEFEKVIDVVLYIFKILGFKQYRARIGTRDNSEKFIGEKNVWEKATNEIKEVAEAKKIPFEVGEGEAAFYGPKLDFLVKDSLGREWQLGTIQVDYNLPERFDLTYITADDKKARPVMIHRAPFGSLERFMGILIEHFGGNFPLWLSPVQVKIITVADRHEKYAIELEQKMLEKEVRVEIDASQGTIGAKVRNAQLEKANYILVVGDREEKEKTVAVRTRKGKVENSVNAETFIAKILKEIEERALEQE